MDELLRDGNDLIRLQLAGQACRQAKEHSGTQSSDGIPRAENHDGECSEASAGREASLEGSRGLQRQVSAGQPCKCPREGHVEKAHPLHADAGRVGGRGLFAHRARAQSPDGAKEHDLEHKDNDQGSQRKWPVDEDHGTDERD